MDELRALFGALGFQDVATFIASGNVVFRAPDRDAAELETEGFNVHVTFLAAAAGPEVEAALRALETPDDLFRVRGREVFWLRRGRMTDSAIRPARLDAAMGGMRNLNTVRRIVAKFGA